MPPVLVIARLCQKPWQSLSLFCHCEEQSDAAIPPILSLRGFEKAVAISLPILSLRHALSFLCKGKGRFSESAPIPLHPVTLKTPHIPLPPYSLRGFSFGIIIEEIPTSRGFAPFLGMTARGAVLNTVIADDFDGLSLRA